MKQTNANFSQKEREELLLKDYKQERHYQQITELALEWERSSWGELWQMGQFGATAGLQMHPVRMFFSRRHHLLWNAFPVNQREICLKYSYLQDIWISMDSDIMKIQKPSWIYKILRQRTTPIAQGEKSMSVAFPTHVWKIPNIF